MNKYTEDNLVQKITADYLEQQLESARDLLLLRPTNGEIEI